MAARIRLKRTGTTNLPSYRIVVADSRSPRDGRAIENLGYYDPKKTADNVKVNLERARHWMSLGALPTETVRSLIKQAERKAKIA